MNKENILYAIIGLLAGVMLGYIGTNSLNRSVPVPTAPGGGQGSAQMPADHPPVANGDAQPAQSSGAQADVTATLEQARREPNNFEAQMKAGDLFYQIRRYDQALEHYTRAHQIRPKDFTALASLGNANFDRAQYEEAARWYEQALALRPEDVNVRTDLGLTYYLRMPRDLDRAIAVYRDSLQRDPRHEQTLQNLVTALIDKGDWAAAADYLKRLEAVNPNNQAIAQFRTRLGAQ